MVLKKNGDGMSKIRYSIILIFAFIVILMTFAGCSEESNPTDEPFVDHTGETGTVTDIDGNIYSTIGIGGQIWMAENLKVTQYRNGDEIPNLTDDILWSNTNEGAYCSYNNDPNIAAVYGNLYNWYTVIDGRNIAPEGWHIPTEDEWDKLINWLGGEDTAGGKLKSTDLWNAPNAGATNESGFSGLPAGMKLGIYYINLNTQGFFRTRSYWNIGGQVWPVNYTLHKDSVNVLTYTLNDKTMGLSVRCVKD